MVTILNIECTIELRSDIFLFEIDRSPELFYCIKTSLLFAVRTQDSVSSMIPVMIK